MTRADHAAIPDRAIGTAVLPEISRTLPAAPDVVARAAAGRPVDASMVTGVRIVRATDGGQLRTVLTGSKRVRTIAYPSRRFRCIRYGEATTECLRIPQEELCPVTVDSIAQPMRIEVLAGGTLIKAVPDFSVLRCDGSRTLVECKRDWSGFRTREAAIQGFVLELGARVLGYGLERYVLANTGTERRRENVDEVQACRFVHVPDAAAARVVTMLERGASSLGRIAAVLDQSLVNGRARAFALAACRLIEIDLEGKLDAAAECRATPPTARFMPSIRR